MRFTKDTLDALQEAADHLQGKPTQVRITTIPIHGDAICVTIVDGGYVVSDLIGKPMACFATFFELQIALSSWAEPIEHRTWARPA